MDPVSAVISGAFSTLNTGLSLYGNKKSQERSIAAQQALFNQQKDWEKEKANSSWQWTMNDLEKAGLNPTLMMGNATGATIAGSSAPGAVGTPSTQTNLVGDMVSALKLSKELGLMDAEKNKIESETNLNNENSGKTQQETIYIMENTKKVHADIKNTLANSRLSEAQRQETMMKIDVLLKEEQKIGEEIKILENQGKITEVQKKYAEANAIKDQITGYVDSAVGVVGAVKGTSALPINVHSKGSSAIYRQPGYLWNQ